MEAERSSDDEAPEAVSFSDARAKSTEELKKRTRARLRQKEEAKEAARSTAHNVEEHEEDGDDDDEGEENESGSEVGDEGEEEATEGVVNGDGEEEDDDDDEEDDDADEDAEDEEMESEEEDGDGASAEEAAGRLFSIDAKGNAKRKKKDSDRLRIIATSVNSATSQTTNLQQHALAFRRAHLFGSRVRRAKEDTMRARKARRPAGVFRKSATATR